MSERALLMGPRRSLVGVLIDGNRGTEQPLVVVFLNSGIIHRVGGNRMTVELCRALASAGVASLRFDLSGIGDSLPRSDALDPYHAAMADIREVIDELESVHSFRRFVLAGLCSGADHSVVYASTDPRIVGVALIDPSIPRTRRYHLNAHLARATKTLSFVVNPRNWLRLRNAVRRRLSAPPSTEDGSVESPLERQEVREFLANAYLSTVRDDRKVLVLLTAGLPEQHNYRDQLLDAFPRLRAATGLTCDYLSDADHTFTSAAQRQSLAERLGRWLSSAGLS